MKNELNIFQQTDRVSKFCMDAGFLSVVWNLTVFHDKWHWRTNLCKGLSWKNSSMKWRIITTKRNGSREAQNNGPVLEVTTSCLYGKHGVEIRIWSLSEDNTQSWVRISHGSNKFVIDSNNNDTEIPEDLPEEQALQKKVKDFAARSKAKAKPQKERTCWLFTEHHSDEWKKVDWYWTKKFFSLCVRDFEESNPSSSTFSIVQREEDGAVQFWRLKNYPQNQFPQIPHWSDDRWKSSLAAGGGAKSRYQYCTDVSGNSVINNGLILGGQNSSKRQTVFFLPVDLMDKGHKDPEKIDLNVPRRAQYLHNAWKKHQDAENWVDIDLAIRKGLTFYQTRSNAIILQGTLPAYCIPKVVRLKTGEVLYEKAYMSPRPPPKISLRHDWT